MVVSILKPIDDEHGNEMNCFDFYIDILHGVKAKLHPILTSASEACPVFYYLVSVGA